MKNLEKLTFYMGKMKVWTGGIEGIDGGTMNLRQRENDGMPGENEFNTWGNGIFDARKLNIYTLENEGMTRLNELSLPQSKKFSFLYLCNKMK